MTVTIRLSGQLREYCGAAPSIELSVTSVREALAELRREVPKLYASICDETGAVRKHVNVFVNKSNIRDLAGLDTSLVRGDVITVLPAVSGG